MFLLYLITGISPLHFWAFLVGSLEGINLVLFFTVQKLPLLFCLSFLLVFLFFICFLGSLIILLQFVSINDKQLLLFLASTDTTSLLFLVLCFSFLVLCFYFLLFVVCTFLIPTGQSAGLSTIQLELSLILINIPLGVGFFIKFFVFLFLASSINLVLLFVLFCFLYLFWVSYFSYLSFLTGFLFISLTFGGVLFLDLLGYFLF